MERIDTNPLIRRKVFLLLFTGLKSLQHKRKGDNRFGQKGCIGNWESTLTTLTTIYCSVCAKRKQKYNSLWIETQFCVSSESSLWFYSCFGTRIIFRNQRKGNNIQRRNPFVCKILGKYITNSNNTHAFWEQ